MHEAVVLLVPVLFMLVLLTRHPEPFRRTATHQSASDTPDLQGVLHSTVLVTHTLIEYVAKHRLKGEKLYVQSQGNIITIGTHHTMPGRPVTVYFWVNTKRGTVRAWDRTLIAEIEDSELMYVDSAYAVLTAHHQLPSPQPYHQPDESYQHDEEVVYG